MLMNKRFGSKVNLSPYKGKYKCLFTVLSFFLFGLISRGQCAMCRAALAGETNVAKAEAVNDGIVYLMVIPYLLVGGIGYYVYRLRKK